VEKAELQFSPRLNVLTGETGAGKSILIGAVNHFLKKKIAENALRVDTAKMVVEAMFSEGDDEFILKREVNRNKSFCYINGSLVPFTRLKEKAEHLFNIYGQNEHVFLLNPNNHRLFLDQFASAGPVLERLAAQYVKLKESIGELRALKRKGEKAAENLDLIKFRIEEIEALKMTKGEDETLEQRAKILSSAEEIRSRSRSLIGDFYQRDGSVYNTVAEHLKDMEFLKGIYPEMEGLNEELNRFYNFLPELSSTLSNIVGHVDYNEDELNEIENKLLRLNRLKSKYHMGLDRLLDKKEELVKERDMLADMDFSVAEKEKEIAKHLEDYAAINLELRRLRLKKGEQLSKIIEKELKKLEMPKARFLVHIEENEPVMDNISELGADRLEFYFTSNPGQAPGRIRDIASGGELSRLMLVLKSILSNDVESTYIFDEIDTGIGGKTAEFVGEKLKRISETNQVICISHLPQIASFADNHFLVSKEFKKNQTFSNVRELEEPERIEEIGRLMVGSVVDGSVLEAARNLLEKNTSRA
jgi:DNA repair protein RecN (Recombination protein N)